MRKEKGKILIEGMDLSGKTTVTKCLYEMLKDAKIQHRTLSNETEIFDFAVAQSKKNKLHTDLINKLYTLAISEDLYNYQPAKNEIILQDSYFALKSYALMKEKYPNTLANEVYRLLQLFPKPELAFYLTTSTEDRICRNKKRDKPMAYMEKLLISNPEQFEIIDKNLKDITISLFNAEIIDTQYMKPEEVALYIKNKFQEISKGENENER